MIAAVAMLVTTVVTGTALAADSGMTGVDASTAQSNDVATYTASAPVSQDGSEAVDVSVSVPAGALPDDVMLEAELVGDTEAVAGTLDDAGVAHDGLLALDVRFVGTDGVEVEPSEPVDVSFSLPASALGDGVDASSIVVSHLAEDADGSVASVDTVADAGDASDGTVAVDGVTTLSADSEVSDSSTVTAEFTVDSFSTFTITWSGYIADYFKVTVHYVDENGNDIQGTQTQSVSISDGSTITFRDYAGDINSYTYSAAHYEKNNGKVVTRMVATEERGFLGATYYLTFYNGSERIVQLSEGQWSPGYKTADIYLVYKSTGESGGDDGGTVTEDATVTTSKTAVRQDGDSDNYDLTLSITGDRGSETDKAAVDVLFVIDRSSSMWDKYGGFGEHWDDSRMEVLQDAVERLVKQIEANENVDARYSAVQFGTGEVNKVLQDWVESGQTLINTVNGIVYQYDVGTNYQAGIRLAKQQLQSVRSGANTYVVFISDGEPTYSYDSLTGDEETDNGFWGGGSSMETNDYAYAIQEISSLTCDNFYAIGVGSNFNSDVLSALCGEHNQYNPNGMYGGVNAVHTGVYSATNTSDLEEAFDEILTDITFFAAKDVTISDQLSDYADIVADATSGDVQFTITVTRAAYTDSDGTQHREQTWTTTTPVGNNGKLNFRNAKGEEITVTAKYDEESKTITLDFPDDYELEEGYNYSVSTVIKPSQAAVDAGMDSDAAQQTPDSGTGTHADNKEQGFWSNDNANAKVTYKANGEDGSALFPKPVIRVTDTTPEPAVLPGTDFVTVKKVIDGRDWLDGESFEFTLTAGTGKDTADGEIAVPMPAECSSGSSGEAGSESSSCGLTIGKPTGENQTTNTNTFGNITFTQAGTYTYTLTEDKADETYGLTYSKAEYKITVTVEEKNGKLTPTVSVNQLKNDSGDNVSQNMPKNVATFTNSLTPASYGTNAHLKLHKSYVDSDENPITLEGGEFSFTLSAAQVNADGYVESTGSVAGMTLPNTKTVPNGDTDGDGEANHGADTSVFDFGAISFSKPGTYYVAVSEDSGGKPNVVYDTSVLYVCYKVATNEQTGVLEVTNRWVLRANAGADVPAYSDGGTSAWTKADLLDDGESFEKDFITGYLTWTNKRVSVSSLPMTGGDTTARNLVLAGGVLAMLAGGAWLLSRRRRV